MAQPHPRAHLTEIADPEEALTWFGAERQVLLAVIRQAAETGFDRHAWQIAWALTDYLFYRGDWHALSTAHSAALAAATRLSEQAGMAYAHRGLAGSDTSMGRHDDARNHLVQALELFRQAGRPIDQALIHRNLALVLRRQGRHEAALGHTMQGLSLCQAAGDRAGYARTLSGAGSLQALLGHYEQALSDCQQALQLLTDIGDVRSQGDALHFIGYVYHQLGRYHQATTYYQRAIDAYWQMGDHGYVAHALVDLSEMYHAADAIHAARHVWHDAQRVLDGLADPDADSLRDRLNVLDRALAGQAS